MRPMKRFLIPLLALIIGFGSMTYAAFPPSNTAQGGTGTTTPSGILYGDNGASLRLNTVIIGGGCTFSGGVLSCPGTGGGVFPFTVTGYGVSTSTTLGFLNGFISTASSTFTGGFRANAGTTTNATSTNFFATTASTSALYLATGNGLLKVTGGLVGVAGLGSDYVNGSGSSGNCVQWGASNALGDAGAPCGSGSGSSFPFTPTSYGVSTTTTIGFLSGLFATASSTFSSTFHLPSLADGGLTVYGGLVSSAATTTAGTGLTYAGNAFNCNTANAATFGCLLGADWTIFNNKISSSSLSAIFPFTPTSYGVSTSTTVGFLNGLFSTASSTFSGGLLVSNSTTTNATSTNLFSTNASSTNLFGANINGFGLVTCTGTNALTWSGGSFSCTAQPQGTVTAISVATANGFAGSSSGGATPALTLTTSQSGLLQGNGTAMTGITGTAGQFPYYNGTNTLLATSSIFVTTGSRIGIGTTNPTDVDANSRLTIAGIGSQDIIASTTDVTSSSNAALFAYADSVRDFIGAHGSAVTTVRYGLTLGGWAEITASTTYQGGTASNGLVIGTSVPTPVVFGTDNTERMRIGAGGNVGIGTTTPQWLLNLATSTAPQLALSNGDGGGFSQWVFRNAGGLLYIATTTTAGTATSTKSALLVDSNGLITNAALAAASGSNCLQVDTVGKITNTGSACGSGGGSAFPFTVTSYGVATSTIVGFTNGLLSTASTTIQNTYFPAGGNVGIGTTTPLFPLTVGTTSTSQLSLSAGAGVAQWTAANEGGNLYLSTTTVAGTATTSSAALSILNTSKQGLGIATGTSAMATLTVQAPNSTDFPNILAVGSTTAVSLIVDNNGRIFFGNYADCNGTTNALGVTSKQVLCDSLVSDQRLKKYITPIQDGLSTVMSLKPVTFFWKDLTNHNTTDPREQYGFIAQDVQKVLPSAVGESPDGYLTLDKTALISPLVKAVQQLNIENGWQWGVIGLLLVWNVWLTIRKRR